MQNICVVVYREKNGKPVPKEDRTGFPVMKELTCFPHGLTENMLIYWEDIDPDAGNACRNQAYTMARLKLDETINEDRSIAR